MSEVKHLVRGVTAHGVHLLLLAYWNRKGKSRETTNFKRHIARYVAGRIR